MYVGGTDVIRGTSWGVDSIVCLTYPLGSAGSLLLYQYRIINQIKFLINTFSTSLSISLP